MAAPVAETILALIQGARLMNSLVDSYQKGRISEEQLIERAAPLAIDVQATEMEWKALEERDAQRRA